MHTHDTPAQEIQKGLRWIQRLMVGMCCRWKRRTVVTSFMALNNGHWMLLEP